MYMIKEDSRTRTVIAIAGVLVLLNVVTYSLYNVMGDYGYIVFWVSDVCMAISAIACAVLCGILWHSFRKGEALRIVWGSLWIGLSLWAIAEVIFVTYDIFITPGDVPYPSAGDYLWVPGYIPLFIAMFYRYYTLRISPPRGQTLIAGAAFGTVAALWLVFVIGPIAENPTSGTLEQQILDIVYPMGDLLLVMGASLSMLALAGGELSLPWGVIALSCLTIAFSDSLYSYATWKDIYQPEGLMNAVTFLSDVTYVAGYVVMAVGLYIQARLQRVL
jgi:hypothetical protein